MHKATKIIIIYLIIVFVFQAAKAQQTAPLLQVCTPHLGELLRLYPRAAVFQRGHNYCVAVGDNSLMTIDETLRWIANGLTNLADAFVIEEEVAYDMPDDELPDDDRNLGKSDYGADTKEWLDKHPEIRASEDNRISLEGLAHHVGKDTDAFFDELERIIRFWDLGEEEGVQR